MVSSQKIVNQDIRRFFLAYTISKESKFRDGDSLRQEIVRLLLAYGCVEIKGYTYSCILFTSHLNKDYDFWQKQIYHAFKQDIRFVFGEIGKRERQFGEYEIGRFKSLRHEDKVFSAKFDRLVMQIDYELKRKSVN